MIDLNRSLIDFRMLYLLSISISIHIFIILLLFVDIVKLSIDSIYNFRIKMIGKAASEIERA